MGRETALGRAQAISRSSLSEQVAHHLRERISSRELLPGLHLDEGELASELGVSRTPVREALRQLAAQGLVEIRSRRGSFVSALTLEDEREIIPILARLEGWVAHEAAERATATDVERLSRLSARLVRVAAEEDADGYWEANRAFHLALQRLAGNRSLENLLGELRRKLDLAGHRSLLAPGRIRRALAGHRAVLKAIQGRRPVEAEERMRDHLLRELDLLGRGRETSKRRRVLAARREA